MQAMIDKVASECIAVRLRMLNRVVTNIYDDALRPLGLKVSQMNILVAAAKMGTARPIEVCEHPATRRFHPQPQRRTDEGAWLAGGRAGRGRPLAAFSPDTPGTQAPGKGGSGLGARRSSRSTKLLGDEGSWPSLNQAPRSESGKGRALTGCVFFAI